MRQTGDILLGTVPNGLLRHFVEQQSVVVLLYEIFQIRIGHQHRLKSAVQHGFARSSRRHQFLQRTVGRNLLYALPFERCNNGGIEGFITVKRLSAFQPDNVVAGRREEGTRHLPGLQSVDLILKILIGHSFCNRREFSPFECCSGILTHLPCHFGKISSLHQGLVDAVGTLCHALQFCICRLLGDSEQDM